MMFQNLNAEVSVKAYINHITLSSDSGAISLLCNFNIGLKTESSTVGKTQEQQNNFNFFRLSFSTGKNIGKRELTSNKT